MQTTRVMKQASNIELLEREEEREGERERERI